MALAISSSKVKLSNVLIPRSPVDSLSLAIREGASRETIAGILDGGVDPNALDSAGNVPLSIAIEKKNREAARLLLERGANPDQIGTGTAFNLYEADPPLFSAIFARDEFFLDLLFLYNANPNVKDRRSMTSLHMLTDSYFTEHQKLSFANKLLEKEADLNARNSHQSTPLIYAVEKYDTVLMSLFIEKGALLDAKDYWENTALHLAAVLPNIAAIKALLENGANPNALNNEKSTPLHLIFHRKLARVSPSRFHFFLQGRFSSSLPLNNPNVEGITPADKEAIELLIHREANPNLQDNEGQTALHLAISLGSTEGILFLLEQGADPTIPSDKGEIAAFHLSKMRDRNGQTLLHWAALRGYTKAISLLLKHGANPSDAANDFGETPLHCAAKGGHPEALQILLGRENAVAEAGQK